MGETNEADILREQIECVFALGGGELEDKPRRWFTRDVGAGCAMCGAYQGRRGWFQHWYSGSPDYCQSEFRHRETFTVIWDTGAYGSHRPPNRIILANGQRARLVRAYRSTGEAECWANHDPQDGECPLCESDHSDASYVYLGEGWIEAIYMVRS